MFVLWWAIVTWVALSFVVTDWFCWFGGRLLGFVWLIVLLFVFLCGLI